MPNRALHYFLPYCIERTESGRYVILNRNYKPLGYHNFTPFVEYEPHAVRLRGLTAKVAAKLSWEGKPNLDRIWLYADHNVPTEKPKFWAEYQERLAILAKLTPSQRG